MNRTFSHLATAAALILVTAATTGCSREGPADDDTALYQANAATLKPGLQPVRIGEGGPGYPACASIGQVVNLSPAGETALSLREAPFVEADEVLKLADGAKPYLCTRSLDQRWQGVVVPPADAPATDCGVTAPLASARAYAGACKSGWVLSSFVRQAAG